MTIKDIASRCGVSIASVSRVINNDPSVSVTLHEKVMRVIDEVGYTPNQIGRQLRMSKSNKILVMIPTLSNLFYSRIIQGIEDKSNTLGYSTLLVVTNLDEKKEEKYLDLLLTKQVDGVLSFFSTLSAERLSALSQKYPFVQCCEYVEKSNTSYVMIDNKHAAYEAVSYLISLGHKNIGMISGQYYRFSELARENGYKKALFDNSIEFSSNLKVLSDYSYEGGYRACKKLMALKNPPTAIFAVSDTNAIGAIKYLSEINKIAGKDIDIIGFDNSSISQAYLPSLSTLSQPRYEIGEMGVSLLIDKINNINSINKCVTLPHKLIIRNSTKQLSNNMPNA